jgi:hypothetical protein
MMFTKSQPELHISATHAAPVLPDNRGGPKTC